MATKADMRDVKTYLKSAIREFELRMTIKFGGMLVVAVVVLALLMKLMWHG